MVMCNIYAAIPQDSISCLKLVASSPTDDHDLGYPSSGNGGSNVVEAPKKDVPGSVEPSSTVSDVSLE